MFPKVKSSVKNNHPKSSEYQQHESKSLQQMTAKLLLGQYTSLPINDLIDLIIISIGLLLLSRCLIHTEKLMTHIHCMLCIHPKAVHWILGDFNLSDVDWQTRTTDGHQYLKSTNENFLEFCFNNQLGTDCDGTDQRRKYFGSSVYH